MTKDNNSVWKHVKRQQAALRHSRCAPLGMLGKSSNVKRVMRNKSLAQLLTLQSLAQLGVSYGS
jgi:hypothetical protein